MTVKLHRCANQWVKLGGHPCWRVEQALIDQGVDYEVVPGPLRKSKRDDLERLSGQRKYPVSERADGTVWREESAAMAEAIRAGKLSAGSAEPR